MRFMYLSVFVRITARHDGMDDVEDASDEGDGVPSYFEAMLRSEQRNALYESAVAAEMERFRSEHGTNPVVMDVGCGTGFLTMLAVQCGATRVIAIDSNPDMCAALFPSVLEENGFTQIWPGKEGEAERVRHGGRRVQGEASCAEGCCADGWC